MTGIANSWCLAIRSEEKSRLNAVLLLTVSIKYTSIESRQRIFLKVHQDVIAQNITHVPSSQLKMFTLPLDRIGKSIPELAVQLICYTITGNTRQNKKIENYDREIIQIENDIARKQHQMYIML